MTYIEYGTFSGCTSLSSIDIPSSITYIGGGAFDGCSSLTSITIPNCITNNSNATFSGCTSLSSIDIPSSVTSIETGAFDECSSLTSLVVPSSVTNIGSDAFYGCSSLIKLEIGNAYGLEKIMSYAKNAKILIMGDDYSDTDVPSVTFSDYALDTLVCKSATPPTLPATFSNSQYINLEVVVPTESLAAYQSADVWKDFWSLKGGAENFVSAGISNLPTVNAQNASSIYDLQGRKLKAPQRGLNIVNGKKVLVK